MDLRIKTFESYKSDYKASCDTPELFWGNIADKFIWQKKWSETLNWKFSGNGENIPVIEWFNDGELNITENILEANIAKDPNKIAFHWEPNHPETKNKSITYQELHDEVCKLANGLKEFF